MVVDLDHYGLVLGGTFDVGSYVAISKDAPRNDLLDVVIRDGGAPERVLNVSLQESKDGCGGYGVKSVGLASSAVAQRRARSIRLRVVRSTPIEIHRIQSNTQLVYEWGQVDPA